MKKIILIICLAPMLVNAELLFYCKTTTGKSVRVEQKNSQISYTFGRNLAKPELDLTKHANDVSMTHEGYSGGGASVIAIPNGAYTYELRSGIRRVSFENGYAKTEDFGSITVLKSNDRVAEIDCIANTVRSR